MSEQAATDGRDQQTLALRGAGRSFSHIATELGYDRASQAVEAFNRAMRLLPDAERSEVQQGELDRLDALAKWIKARHGGEGPDVTRRLQAVEGLRRRLLRP